MKWVEMGPLVDSADGISDVKGWWARLGGSGEVTEEVTATLMHSAEHMRSHEGGKLSLSTWERQELAMGFV